MNRKLPQVIDIGAMPVFNNLDDVAAAINEQHRLAVDTFRRSLEHARRAGELLLTAKEYLKAYFGHGQFVRWRKRNCRLSKATAERYQRLAANWVEVKAKSESLNLRHLTIDAAIHLLMKDRSAEVHCGRADNRSLFSSSEAPIPIGQPTVRLAISGPPKAEFRCPCCGHEWSGEPRPKEKPRLAA